MALDSPSGNGEDAALAAIVRSSQDAVIAKTVDGTVTAWNAGAERLYGYTPEQILGRNIEITFPPDTREEEVERHARVAAGASESGYRCRRVRRDGSEVEVVMSMLAVHDGAGRITGLASISRPVSEEERTHEQFAALLGAAPDAIIGVDESNRVSVLNRRVVELFGYDTPELQGAPAELLVPGLLERSRQVGFGAPRVVSELTAHRKDGSTFPVEVGLSRTSGRPGSLLIATLRDVAQQRALESELRESATRLRQLAENVTTVFSLRQIDPPAYLYVSPGVEGLTGYRAEELYADPELPFVRMVHPDDVDMAAALRSRIDEASSAVSEYRIRHRDGRLKWIRVMTTVVPNPDGPPERVVGMVEDVTERVEALHRLAAAEAEARSANEAKNLFLSRMSHELRTPLNAVLGFGQLLDLKLRGTVHEDAVHHVLQGGRHLLALIDDVLDIARIESGEMSVSLEPVSVPDLAEETLRLMTPIAHQAGVTLVPPEPGSEFVCADSQRLRQVLLNLVSNAVKYNRRGGTVRLSWRREGEHVGLDVADDGPGIPTSLQHRLFLPFDRLGAEVTAVEGTGVGLALSRALVELMQGSISCRSEAGEGAVFTVTLPVALTQPDPQVATERPDPDSPTLSRHSRTLLYVEDNTANVDVMQAVLELRPEWAFVHAALGGLAMDLARAHRPDLVLLDLHLPDGSGVDVLRALRSDPETSSSRVVVLSADASKSTIHHVLDLGADAYLTKPYDLDSLLELLDDAALSPREGGPT